MNQYAAVRLEDAIAVFHAEFPGWWFSVGDCSVSADASIGPDRAGRDAKLLIDRRFDDGFHCDLRHPATMADALREAMNQARAALLVRSE